LQDSTKTSQTKEEKISSWNSLKNECIRELFLFIFTSQIFLSSSYIIFSLTGKQLFEIHSGKGKNDSIHDLAERLQSELNEDNDNTDQTEESKENKKNAERKEKITNIVHKHLMELLFEVLTQYTTHLKNEIIDPIVDETLSNIKLTSSFT
jgi:hypothetical protein